MTARRHALQLVLDALRPDAGGASGAERRRAARDWDAAVRLANAHYVGPAMYANLAASGRLGELPAELADYLALLHRCNRDRNAALKAQADELIAALNRVALRPVLLKGGISLYGGIYRDPAVRMIRDLDLLLPASTAERAIGVLRSLGYRPQALYPAGHHAYGDFVRAGAPGAVDLHFDLVDCAHVFRAAELIDHAIPVRHDAIEFAVPSPTDCVLHHLLHAQIHHLGKYYRGVLELRQLYEFVALIRRHGAAIDLASIAWRLARHRLRTAFEAYVLSAHRLLDMGWLDRADPSTGARLQHLRCVAMLLYPGLEAVIMPVANLQAAFAWHRMAALYGDHGRPLQWRLGHLGRYVRKSTPGLAFRRLLKAR